jgi:V8-like Glu-specific endopeptidase
MTGFEFEVVVVGGLLELIHDAREAAGETSATEGLDDPDAFEGRRGIEAGPDEGDGGGAARSDGIDTRTIRTPTTAWPWRTICHFNNNCTGTLIGPRHIITAAHCINQQGTNTWFSFTVRPGRDGSNVPYGSSAINPNPMPGDPFRWYFTPAPWRDPTTSNVRQWDWGLIIIPDRLGESTGWMGYVARPSNELNAVSHYNRGYPACGLNRPDVPVGCQPNRLYGDTNTCVPGSYSAQGGNGWNRLIDHACDTSGGHSGSAVYHYFLDPQLGQSVPVVSMIHVSSPFCDGSFANPCMSQHDFPSRSRRIEPDALATISFFRSTYP